MPRPIAISPITKRLLVELATEGFAELRDEIKAAVATPDVESDRIAKIGAAYMRFVARRPALARLMFGPQLPNRDSFPELGVRRRRGRSRNRRRRCMTRRSALRCGRRCMALPC